MTTEPKDTWDIQYEGETAVRHKALAAALTLLHPSLGYLYVGKARAAIAAGLFFTAYLGGFVALLWATDVFPVLPALTFLLSLIVLPLLCMIGVLREAGQEGEGYLLRGFNHPVVYTLVFLGVGVIPLYAASHLISEEIYATVHVVDNSMFPTVLPGDVLLVDRAAWGGEQPQRGDLVVVATADREGEAASHVVGRVIAKAGDQVTLDGDKVLVNEEALPRELFATPISAAGDTTAAAGGSSPTYIEMNDGNRYLIAGAATPPPSRANQATITVSEGSLLILGDNRARAEQRRHFGAVAADRILGQPRYILYSEAPAGGSSAWSRMGYRIR